MESTMERLSLNVSNPEAQTDLTKGDQAIKQEIAGLRQDLHKQHRENKRNGNGVNLVVGDI